MIKTRNIYKVQIHLYDLSGKENIELYNSNLDKGNHSLTFDISSQNGGFYFMKAQIGNKTIIKSIIKP